MCACQSDGEICLTVLYVLLFVCAVCLTGGLQVVDAAVRWCYGVRVRVPVRRLVALWALGHQYDIQVWPGVSGGCVCV